MPNGSDWLSQLAPDHAPPAAGWWPLAPGWWGLIVLFVLIAAGLWWWWRQPQRRLRAQALRELKQVAQRELNAKGMATAIENLLRRFALARFGRERVARLSGKAWLEFVVNEGGAELAGESGQALLAAVYGGQVADLRTQWLAGARAFIKAAGKRRRGG